MTNNFFMLAGLAALAVFALRNVSGDTNSGLSSVSSGSSGSGSVTLPAASDTGVTAAVSKDSGSAPMATVVNTGGGSGMLNVGTSFATWKKNADGTYTDTKGTPSKADDVNYAWQKNNPSAGVVGAVSGVSKDALDARIAQDRSTTWYADTPITSSLPTLTKANVDVVGSVTKSNTSPVLITGNVQSKEVGGNDVVGTILDLASLGARGNTVVSPALSIGGAAIQNIYNALTGSGVVKVPSLGVAGVIA